MKKIFWISFFLLPILITAQDRTPRISITFQDKTLTEVVEQLGELTDYQFFYVPQWLGTKVTSGNFEDVELSELLDFLFGETNIQYHVGLDNKVYLIRNQTIYDELPTGFFGRSPLLGDTIPVISESEDSNPIFLSLDKEDGPSEIKTIRIGKASSRAGNKKYTLTGFAKSNSTGEPIPNLAVVVKGGEDGAVTNIQGYYEIELPYGKNTLITKSLGFGDTETNVIMFNNGQYDFVLNESLEQLEEVIVEGSARTNVEDATTGSNQILSEETKNIPLVLGERDVLKVATTLPGITTAGEGAAGFNVRGGNTDQNLILLDGAVIYNPSHFFGIFQALNPFAVKDATIYKGNIPARFGGRLSSVFDISTKDGNTSNFSAEASIGPVTSNVVLETPIVKDKASLLIGGRGTYSDWILRSLDDEALNNSEASFYDLIAKYTHKLDENNSLSATAYYSKDNFSITSDSLFGFGNRMASIQWDRKFSEKTKGQLVVSNSQYDFDIEFDGNSNQDFELGYTINETEVKLNFVHILNDKHTLDFGVSSKLYLVDPGDRNPLNPESTIESLEIPREKGLESAVFISDNFKLSDKFLIDAGVRVSVFSALGLSTQRIYEDNQPRNETTLVEEREFGSGDFITTYAGPEFRLSARYLLAPDLSVKASFNNTFQYIHTLSNTTTVSPIDTWKLSDTNIEPARAFQYSLGVYKNLQEDMYELSLEGYYKTSSNVLDFKVGADLLLNEEIEQEILQGEGKAYGVELLMRKNRGKLNGWLGYTYSRSFLKFDSEFREERINDGDFFPSNFDRPHDVSLVANYKLTKRFSLSTNFVYQTGRPITFPVGSFNFNNSEFVLFSNRNEFRIPDYYRLDIGLNIEGNHKIKKFAHSFWTISVYNVLGRNNPYSVFFLTDNGEVKALQSSIFAIPIPSITYNFKF
ncbi:TonB-dependent receptor [Flagellimonas sp. S174]|uniref:TonB-dependent receptor n=1 Tax=Flagellimonas sp. S174 TaxID=3410790 RepID=UPI003BF53409